MVDVSDESDKLAVADFDAQLQFASQQAHFACPEPVWNTGFWQTIFGPTCESSSSSLTTRFPDRLPVVQQPGTFEQRDGESEPTSRKRKLRHVMPNFMVVVKSRPLCDWQTQRDAQHKRGLRMWDRLIAEWSPEVTVATQLSGIDEDERVAILGDQSKLQKELAAVHFPFPPAESQLYSCLSGLRRQGAKASAIKGCLEALTFCRFVLAVEELQQSVTSRRCHGVAWGIPEKRPSQAAPLTVNELQTLHDILSDHRMDAWDRLFSGATLFCVYARARWSDFQHGDHLTADMNEQDIPEFLEMSVTVHKTMRASANRRKYMDLAAPAVGVTGANWAQQW